jgi:phosphoglycolate phosphatase-like HAD superfamily hydrolase
MRRLVLWDIDGTLVSTGQLGRDAFSEAFQVVIGRAPRSGADAMVEMAGRTDHEIALEFLALHEIDGQAHLPAFSDALAAALAAKEAEIRTLGQALPGAEEALAAVGRSPGVVQSLLTGNIEPNAAVKLAAFGLEAYLDFDVGGFGSDDPHRPNLVAVARRKAKQKYGIEFDPATTVLVGDTPLDVAAGIQGGARVVAVATGPFGPEQLHAAGAEVVLPDLRDTAAVLDAVLERNRG